MRPRELDEVVGQDEVIGAGTTLRAAIEKDEIGSIVLWGPPGSGKTTLARIIARQTQSHFVPFSAVTSGIKEIKDVMRQAESQRRMFGRRTLLFVDEIHRFNKAQQDAFLPHVESGNVSLIGATTENPSFEVNAALLSRCRVVILRQLSPEELVLLMKRALADDERGLAGRLVVENEEALSWLAHRANGDARFVLNVLEALCSLAGEEKRPVGIAEMENALQRKALLYDKTGEEHFNLISALHKSLRSSDVNASLYWLARMLEAGEDPLYVARRIVRFASEDVGLAEPGALAVAVAAKEAFHFIGLPEGKLALAQAVVYLALAPKSNALYLGYDKAAKDALEDATEPVPLQLRNPVTKAMREWGYGRGYDNAHDHPTRLTAMECLPERLRGRAYYEPTEEGFEKRLKSRIEEIGRLGQALGKKD
ncbi:MAG TPA: replication-associated recombination protein A [Vicinamibacteria bacterium]|nr:replication-associated recombination protein A [Vicinamibacteria bacterium]